MNILIYIALAILFCHIVSRPRRPDPTLGGRIISRRHDVVIQNTRVQTREIVARELDLIEAYETLRYRKECAKRRERFERELQ
jgi:hypothetical protein